MDNFQITSEIKQKDPRRVEQGKRLPAISKEAKERKARKRLIAQQELEKDDCSGSSKKYIVVGIILAGAGAYYVYGKYKSKRSEQKSQSKQQSESKSKQQSEQSEKLVNLFD